MSERSIEVEAFDERIDFDGSLGSRREGMCSALASVAETTESSSVARKA